MAKVSHNYNLRRRMIVDNTPIKKHKAEITHEEFHFSIKYLDIHLVKNILFTRTVKPCYDKGDNCFILAQNNRDPDFLKVLLEYDPSGVNAVNSIGDTLLMRDIRYFKCRNFHQLINIGASINQRNVNGYSVLHYAIQNETISLDIIRKLIELNADVNAATYLNPRTIDYLRTRHALCTVDHVGAGNTPLILALLNINSDNILQKVKLLVESGADVNLSNHLQCTPLMFACLKSADISVIRYLVTNGARGDIQDCNNYTALDWLVHILCTSTRNLSYQPQEWSDLTKQFFIPAVDVLIEAGAGKFMFVKNLNGIVLLRSAFLTYLCHECKIYMRELVLHLIKIAFNRLPITNTNNVVHPLISVLENLSLARRDSKFIEGIADLIINHPTNEFKNFPKNVEILIPVDNFLWKCVEESTFGCYHVSVVGAFVASVPLKNIKYWLAKLKEEKFDFLHEFPLLVLLLLRFIQQEIPYTSNEFIEIIEYIINTENPINSSTLQFSDTLDVLQTIFNIPDCIWISAVFGNVDILKKLLPYWNQHPLTVILFLRPWLETDQCLQKMMLNSINYIFPHLIKIGGPVPHGTKLYDLMKKYIKSMENKDHLDLINEDGTDATAYKNVLSKLRTSMKGDPVSLKLLCRTVVRAASNSHGNNLPNYLASLVPPGLENFITLNEL